MKMKTFIILAVLVLMLASLVPVVSAQGSNAPGYLIKQSWTCVPCEGKYLFCMVPDWKTPNQLQTGAIISAMVDQIDIPTSRADYAALDLLPECLEVAGFNIIPVTDSRQDLGKQRYEDFKILQAERMSG